MDDECRFFNGSKLNDTHTHTQKQLTMHTI